MRTLPLRPFVTAVMTDYEGWAPRAADGVCYARARKNTAQIERGRNHYLVQLAI